MSRQVFPRQIRAQELVGRVVRNAAGKKLGRVVDLAAERDGDDLRVTAVIVGRKSWLTRLGPSKTQHGTRVEWEQIVVLEPDIVLRGEGRR